MRTLWQSLTRQRRYAFTVWLALFTAATAWANWSSFENDQRQDDQFDAFVRLSEREDARDCINQWERFEGSREVIDRAMVGSGEALIEVVGGSAEPALVQQYRDVIRLRIADAQAAVEEPHCDRQAAQEFLEGQ